jgi:MFS family permease
MAPSRSRSLAALLVVCLGTLAAPLDSSVNIAFPSITAAFGLPQAGIRWVVIAYVLTYASLTLVFGKLGDILGYRRIFRVGLVIAAAGFLACSIAERFDLLLAGRILQGIGIALVWSCAPALATTLYPEDQRTRVLAFYSAAVAFGAALGPLAGGFLVERFGWPVVFWARLPLVLSALALCWLVPAQPPGAVSGGARRPFDWTGAILLVVWMCAFLLAAARPFPAAAGSWTLVLVGVGAVAFAAFLVHELRHSDPIIQPRLFRDGDFLVLNLSSVVVNFAGFSVMLLVPFHLARTAGLDPGLGGLVLGANASGVVAGSWLAGKLTGQSGPGALTFAGAVVSVLGLGLVSAWERDTAPGLMAACLVLQGLGLGLFQVAYADQVLATLPRTDRGVAGSLTLLTRTLGIVGAAAGLSELSRQLEVAARGAGDAESVLAAFKATFLLVSLGLGAGVTLVACRSILRGARRT